MKKRIVVLGMTAGLALSMGLVGCSSNTGNSNTTPTGTTTETVVESVVESEPVVETESMESIDIASGSEIDATVEAEEVELIGEIKEMTEDSIQVLVDGGLEVEALISEETELDDGLDIGSYVSITYDGMMTKSIPAQLPNVKSIKINLDDESITGEGVEAKSVEEVNEDEGEAVVDVAEPVESTGVITEVNEKDIHFVTDDGVEIIANISEETEVYPDMKVGDKIMLTHSQVMTMSLPGILPQVYTINLVE